MMTIRPYDNSDYDFVYQSENDHFHPMTSSEFASYYLEDALIQIEMIMLDDHIIGYLVIWQDLDKSQIYSIYIKPDFRRKHYAYGALVLLEEKLKNNGVKEWTLEVRKSNQAAIKLYQKMGFEIVLSRDHYYQNHEDAWLMLKRL